MRSLLLAAALIGASTLGPSSPLCGTAYAYACCKVCKAGKACGDSCISKSKTCTKGSGCACNG